MCSISDPYRQNSTAYASYFGKMHSASTVARWEARSYDARFFGTNLRVVEALLLAAVDPYMARALGQYYVDRSYQFGSWVLYWVEGDWGGSSWPWIAVPFKTVRPVSSPEGQAGRPIEQSRNAVREGRFALAELEIFSPRETSLEEGEGGENSELAIRLSGSAGVPVSFTFAEPIQCIKLKIRSEPPVSAWRASQEDRLDDNVIHLPIDASRLRYQGNE